MVLEVSSAAMSRLKYGCACCARESPYTATRAGYNRGIGPTALGECGAPEPDVEVEGWFEQAASRTARPPGRAGPANEHAWRLPVSAAPVTPWIPDQRHPSAVDNSF